MELNKKTLTVPEVLFFKTFEEATDGDLIVPDVKPDILKVLQVTASATISKKDFGESSLSLFGHTDLCVLYISDEPELGIQCIKNRFDFVMKKDIPNIDKNCHIRIACDVEKVDFHVINSRKLHLKAINTIDVEAIYGNEISYFENSSEDVLKTKEEQRLIDTLIGAEDFEFFIKESISVPSGKGSIGEILNIDYKIFDKEIRPITEKVIVKATIGVCVLYLDNAGNIEYTESEIPFTEVFDFPDAVEDSIPELNFRFSQFSYSLSPDTDGDLKVIDIDASLFAEIKLTKQVTISLITDCFCPGKKTEISFENKEITEIISSVSSKNSLRENVVTDPSLPQISRVYNVITNAYITSSRTENERIGVDGKVVSYILYLTEDADNPICSYKKEFPFSYYIDSPNAKEGMRAIIDVETEHTSYRLNTASEVEIRCILNISAKVLNSNDLHLINDVSFYDIPKDYKKGIIVYFVQPGDTLWEIAKNYSVSPEDILSFNNIDDKNKLSIGERLIIPSV